VIGKSIFVLTARANHAANNFILKRCFYISLMSVCFSFVSASLFAAPRGVDPGFQQQINREEDIQNKMRMQESIDRELLENKKRSETAAEDRTAPNPPPSSETVGPTIDVVDIQVDAGDVYAGVDVDDILKAYTGRKIGNADLFSLIRDVTNRYAKEGYVTTSVSLIPKNLRDGVVCLKINWGLVEGWHVNGKEPESWSERAMVMQAIPDAVGKPLNIHAVDQAIENLNNYAKSARIDVEPSDRAGYSILSITTAESHIAATSFSVDNSGAQSPSYGRNRYSASTSFSDVLLGNDTLSVNGSTRRFQDDGSNAEYAAGLSYSVPFGYSQIDMRFNETQFKREIDGYYGAYDSDGNSKIFGLKVARTLLRDKTSKLTGFLEYEHRTNANYIEGTYLEVNSRPYDSLTSGLQYVTRAFGGSLYSDAAFTHGLSTLGSDEAAFSEDGHAKAVKKISFNNAWSRQFAAADRAFDYSFRMGGQYSRDTMLSSYKQGLGDEFTVRGFKGTPLWGDRAIFMSHTISAPISFDVLQVNPFVGLDAGYVNDVNKDGQFGQIVGAAIGVRLSWLDQSFALSVGAPLSYREDIQDSVSPYEVYFTGSLSI
jgi:hemolysin activation/secretion protein